MISIECLDDTTYKITVSEDQTTVHTVTLTEDYYHELTNDTITPEELLTRSFNFLLEREDNTEILTNFDLSEIQKYYPEYEKTIIQ